MFKSIAIASAITLAAGLATAQAPSGTAPNTTSQQRQATPAAANSQMGKQATDYWTQRAKGGYMTREDAMGYRTSDGKDMDYARLDGDGDGRISQSEWTNYHGNAGATGGQSAGAGATGSGTMGPDKGARSGSTPRPTN